MARRIALVFSFVLGLSTYGAGTQSSAQGVADTCWIAGLAFSPGAAVRASDTVMVCQEGGVWVGVEQQAAGGCFFAGEFYSTGARREVPGIPGIKTICIQNGTWREFGADEQPQGPAGGRRQGQ